MNHFLGYGTSSGDLNTGGNLSALFGLELGPTDFTEFHRSLPYAGWDFADDADDADFFAAHLSPITIYWKKSGKLLIANGVACVTGAKKGNLSLTHQSRFWLYPSRFCLCCKAKRLFCD